jgi:BNR repeat-like domain
MPAFLSTSTTPSCDFLGSIARGRIPRDRSLLLLIATLTPHALFTGSETDYQPSIAAAPDGTLIVVFERLNASVAGDLYVTRSPDGVTWSAPTAIVQTSANERAPSLVATPSGYLLFFLSDGAGGFRIHRGTSPDGEQWTTHGAIDLGWPTGGEINPDVIREAGGSLTMTYQRLGSGSYISLSTDGGATWDTRRTLVAGGSALPRVAKRESDGTYLVTYQVNPGNSRLQMFSKTSGDPYDWSAAAAPLSVDANSHDSDPHVLADGRFAVVYADARGSNQFDLFFRTSSDGRTWSAAAQLTRDASNSDVQPHLYETGGKVLLLWSRDFDLWIDELDLRARRRSVGF